MASRLEQNLEDVRRRIAAAAQRAGRPPESVTLVAVTKTVPAEVIRELVDLGVTDLGENRLQTALPKIESLDLPVRWHMIGHLQRNKIRRALPCFSLIHSLDSDRLAATIQDEADRRGTPAPVLLQVNVSGESSKGGFEPDGLVETWSRCRKLTHLRVRGLMTMAPLDDDPEAARPVFRRLRELRDEIRSRFPEEDEPRLSMGMSGDFEVAVEEGAHWVRVGTALFSGIESAASR